MTNEPRQMVRDLDQNNEHERGVPCFVQHPDAEQTQYSVNWFFSGFWF